MKKHFNCLPFVLLISLLALPISSCATANDLPPVPGLSAWYRADKVETSPDNLVKTWPGTGSGAQNLIPGDKAPSLVSDGANGQPAIRFSNGATLRSSDVNWSENGFTVFVVASAATGPEEPAFHTNHRNITTPGKTLISDGGRFSASLGLNWTGRAGGSGGVPEMAPLYDDFEPPFQSPTASDLLVEPRKFYAFSYESEEGKSNKTRTGQSTTVTFCTFVNGLESSQDQHETLNIERQFGGTGLQLAATGVEQPFQGDIAEVIIFNRALKPDERTQVLAYLSGRYGLNDKVKRTPAEPVDFSPAFDPGTFWFDTETSVVLKTPTKDASIRYTLDGSEPKATSPLYSAPLKITQTTVVKAAAFAAGRDASPARTVTLSKVGPVAKSANKLPGGWKYSWGDEFEGPEIDTKLWDYEKGYLRNAEIQYFTDRKENARIENGHLLIQGLHDNWQGNEYTSASLATASKAKLTYGRYEIRGQIDVRSGSWPAWWIFAKPGGTWPGDGEIDMMEYYMGKVNTNVMDGKGGWYAGNKRSAINKLGGPDWVKAFHTWTMDWDADRIRMYIDGRLKVDYPIASADGTGPNGTNPFRNPETKQIILEQALGGTWGGPVNPADAPFEFRADYMRVHKWSEEPAYTLTVNGGAGSGPYVVGSPASVEANMAPAGYVFDRWIANISLAAPKAPILRLPMPAADVTLTALYKPAPISK